MSCKSVCKLCDNLIISQAVAFTGGNLEINIPAGSYKNGEKYCIVVAQTIPTATTINAPVYITIVGNFVSENSGFCCADSLFCRKLYGGTSG